MNESWAPPSRKEIAIILGTRYPTEKAYGVTTAYSAKEASSLGYQVSVISPRVALNSATEPLTTNALQVNPKIPFGGWLQVLFGSKSLEISKLAFQLHTFLFKKQLKKIPGVKNFSIYWLRDVTIAEAVSNLKPNCRIILELHTPLRVKEIQRLRKLSRKSDLILAPISPVAVTRLKEMNFQAKIVYSPMGIDIERFSRAVPRLNQPNIQKEVVYLGKFTSLGASNGLETLLNTAKLAQHQNRNIRFKLVGGSDSDTNYFRSLAHQLELDPGRIEITGEINFDAVAETMAQADCLVLPYPTLSQFEYRYPIKIHEYSASRRPVICSDSPFLRAIISDESVTFFREGDPQSLLDAINYVLDEKNFSEIQSKVNTSFTHLSEVTWSKRTQNLLRELM